MEVEDLLAQHRYATPKLDTLPQRIRPIPVRPLKGKHIPLWLLLSLCVSTTAWLYVHEILGPWTDLKDLQKGEFKAQMGDLYPRWVGAREILLNRRNPYSPEVSHEIQMAYYGHVVT